MRWIDSITEIASKSSVKFVLCRGMAGAILLAGLVACSGKSLEPGVPAVGSDAIVDTDTAARQLSWWSRVAIDALMRFDVWRGSRSGYVALFALDGHAVYANTAGWADLEQKRPMTLDTRMRFASMTKPLTAVAAMILVEREQLSLDDPVARYIPAFAGARVAVDHSPAADGHYRTTAADPLLVRHLITFASGIGPGREAPGSESELWRAWMHADPRQADASSLDEATAQIATLPLFEQPGTRWRYGWSADVLARVVEVASGQSFSQFLQREIFDPLGMVDTSFLPPADRRHELATVYITGPDGELIPIIPDSDTDYAEGGSGLISTARDYLRFALMLWNGGEYLGARVLNIATVAEMRSLHVSSGVLKTDGIDGVGWGLGMAVVADSEASLTPDRDGDFWWSGYLGTTFTISPEAGLVGVVLTQHAPGPAAEQPTVLYIIQALAFAGL